MDDDAEWANFLAGLPSPAEQRRLSDPTRELTEEEIAEIMSSFDSFPE
jgi:hypothetical protein